MEELVQNIETFLEYLETSRWKTGWKEQRKLGTEGQQCSMRYTPEVKKVLYYSHVENKLYEDKTAAEGPGKRLLY